MFYLPICFFYYLAKLIIFIRSSKIPCIFLEGDSRAFIREKETLPFRMWFQRYEFLKDSPLHFMGKPYEFSTIRPFFVRAWNIYLSDECSLLLICYA